MNFKAIVYSPPGHGKTTLIGSAADDERTWPGLLLDLEGGTMAISSKTNPVTLEQVLDDKHKTPKGKLDVLRITNWKDFEDVLNHLYENNPYKFVAIDSLTEVNYLSLQSAVEWAVTRRPQHDPEVPEIADHQRNTVRMRKLVRFFRDLDCNVLFSAASMSYEGLTMPSMTGKLPADVAGLVDIVGYLGLDSDDVPAGQTPKRFLLTTPTNTIMAKDRSEGGKLGTGVDNPTITKILDLLNGPTA